VAPAVVAQAQLQVLPPLRMVELVGGPGDPPPEHCAAGVNLKALSSYLGHASITITLDRYGHLMPGSQDEAVGLVDSYLERAAERAGAPN
jgi:hypothetical protein